MSDNKRIAKNTMFLYMRMFLTMGVSLYTSRVILSALGVEDYGVYSLVGGIVASFGFLSSTISSANSRFLSYALGTKDDAYLKKIFSLTNTSNVIIAVVILIVSEIAGIWWINNKLVVPENKIYLAHILFQISLLSSIVSLLTSSFLGLIISYEKMGLYAVSQLLQVIFKLVIVLVLPYLSYNSAISYAVLLLLVSVGFLFYYIVYTKRHFACTNFKLILTKELREIFSFSSWDLYGNFSVTMRTQGISVLQNMFFGIGINAAIGIANQVQAAVSTFASNILFASKPQVIKSFAQGDHSYMNTLIIKSAKYSTLFLAIIIVPLFIEMEFIINLWLGIIPEYVITLIKWFLLFVIGANISSSVMMGIHATGKIKKSSLINGTLYLLVIPLTYILFKFYKQPEIPYILNLVFVIIGANLNMRYLKESVPSFSIKELYIKAIIPVLMLSIINYFILSYLKIYLTNDFMSMTIVVVSSTLFMIVASWLFLIEKDVKHTIKKRIWK